MLVKPSVVAPNVVKSEMMIRYMSASLTSLNEPSIWVSDPSPAAICSEPGSSPASPASIQVCAESAGAMASAKTAAIFQWGICVRAGWGQSK